MIHWENSKKKKNMDERKYDFKQEDIDGVV